MPPSWPGRTSSSSGCRTVIRRCSKGVPPICRAASASGWLSRALIHNPPVLVLDEATSSLDPESEAIIQQHLAAMARGRTIVIITHRLSFVARADAIIVVDHGPVGEGGKHQALLGSCVPPKQLWSPQARGYPRASSSPPPPAPPQRRPCPPARH